MTFDWDPDKDNKNYQKHKIHLSTAIPFFEDPDPDEEYDEEHSTDEIRYRGTFRYNDYYLYIVYTIRNNDIIRIISARLANRSEIEHYYRRSRVWNI